jgi:hypothetical protein
MLPCEKGLNIKLIERLVCVLSEMWKAKKTGVAMPLRNFLVVAQQAEMVERIEERGGVGLAPDLHTLDLLVFQRLFSGPRHQLTK